MRLPRVVPTIALLGVVGYAKLLRVTGLGRLPGDIALRNMRSVRWDKLEKPPVMIVALQKSGSTLLCYISAMVNIQATPGRFRNDFDLVPMLSFSKRAIAQNFNARQDGRNQLYKINGYLMHLDEPLSAALGERKRVVWMSREFTGYYRSVFWWVRSFYPHTAPGLFFLRWTNWRVFRALTFEVVAQAHVDELWYAYNRQQTSSPDEFLFLSYEHLTDDKAPSIRLLGEFLDVDVQPDLVTQIVGATSKSAMAESDRFDPINFGDGQGVSKVNLSPHRHDLSEAESERYRALFAERFSGTGIASYEELIEVMREYHAPTVPGRNSNRT